MRSPQLDRDRINKRVLDGMVYDVKSVEAKKLNDLGEDAQLAYLIGRHFSTNDMLDIFENPLEPGKRESVALQAIERLAPPGSPPSASSYPVECIEELAEIFEYVPEVHDLISQLTAMLETVDSITVECSNCHKPAPRRTAHLHGKKYIGDECCWNKSLPTTE
jgi:hypothetical protein